MTASSLRKTLGENSDYLWVNITAGGNSIAELQDPNIYGILQVQGYPITTIEAILDWSIGVYAMDEINRLWTGNTDSLENLFVQAQSTDPKKWQRFDSSKHSRRVCRTTGSFIGTVPKWAKPGDQVWILLGGRLPFVLRSGYEVNRKTNFDISCLRDQICEVVGPSFFPECMGGRMYKVFCEKREDGNQGGIPELHELSLV
jgi:hypothetical protein